MARELEMAVHAILAATYGPEIKTPDWLQRPGLLECGNQWPTVQKMYEELTGDVLPDTMPPRERRRVDGVFYLPSGRPFIFELDEKQHFNGFRAVTLGLYPDDVLLGFPKEDWIARSKKKKKLEGGGFAKPKPPLFPGENGRHRQRAFRDALADVLPQEHGFAPTLRIADDEVSGWIRDPGAKDRIVRLVADRLGE